jgi:glycerol uptake facilitator-like aquaporin
MAVRGQFFACLRRVSISRNTVAANTARDVGGRLAAMAIWGTRANGGRYGAIAALTNILATVLAYAFYEFVLKDSSRRTLHMIIICALLVLFSAFVP